MRTFKLILLLLAYAKWSIAQCEIQAKRVTVFKDATVFIERAGNCDITNQQLLVDLPYQNSQPNKSISYNNRKTYVSNHIILGTLDIQSPNNPLVSSRKVKVKKEEAIRSLQKLFDLNVGKRIKITFKDSGKTSEGIIFALEKASNPRLNHLSNSTSLVLKKEQKWSVVDLSDIQDFEFLEEPEQQTTSETSKLHLSFAKNQLDQELKISYLQKGITWTPNYFINIKNDEQLELVLKANVVNDIIELSEVDLNLAVGVPVFKYAPIGDPLFSNQRIIELIASLNNLGEHPKSPMTNVITSQRSSSYVESYGNNATPQIEGQMKDDIFLYQLKGVSLNKFERVSLDLLTIETSYKDLYLARLASNEGVASNNRRNQDTDHIHVWHGLQFKNNGTAPLTTGTVFFKRAIGKKKMLPISQGQLDFTPSGQSCTVKMSVAPNITILHSELEKSRKENPDGYGHFVNVEASIEVNNVKDEAIKMMVTRSVKGTKLVASTENWETIQSTRSLYDFNQNNLVRWMFEVPAREKKVVTYQYQVYVR